MVIFVKKVYRIINGFLKRLADDHVAAYAAQASFFMIISGFPLALLIFNLIRYTPITQTFLMETMVKVTPKALQPIAESLIVEMYEKTSGTYLSITAIFTVWAASKGVMSIVTGFNNVFKVKERRNYFYLRILSSIYTVIFVVGIVLSLVLLVFGNSLLHLFEKQIPLLYDVVEWIMGVRVIYIPIILTLLFIGLYKLTNNRKYSTLSHLPGAFFSAVCWMVFSFFYSLYIDNFAGRSYAYGSLTTLVFLMLWIYICMYILFIGAEINVYFRHQMILIKETIKLNFQRKKNEKSRKKI